jgi:hypothetical protein
MDTFFVWRLRCDRGKREWTAYDIHVNLTFHSRVFLKPLGPSQRSLLSGFKPNAGLRELSGINSREYHRQSILFFHFSTILEVSKKK